MKQETANKAAKWWADQLRGHAKLDNGDNSETGFFGMALGMILQEREKSKQSTEQMDKFEKELADALIRDNTSCFGVDYHPDYILELAAENAGLPLGMTTLPWKTTMWIDGDKVTVRCGYGAEAVTLP